MIAIAASLAVVLAALAALHAYWGLGGVWPGRDPADCVRRIGGFRGVQHMPGPGACFAVAAALAVAALIAMTMATARGNLAVVVAIAGVVVATVFLGRGVAGYTPAWRRLTPEQPFATYDTCFYSPLCLAIGAGFAVLALGEFLS